jgi:hypothetical protein
MGLFFRTATTMEQKATDEMNVLYRMVVPNLNVNCVDMNRLADLGAHNSMPNAIMADAETLEEILPKLDAKFSILPYK